jgi:hypothetical protein
MSFDRPDEADSLSSIQKVPMSDKYLLPCECGQSVPIGISEAGKEVSCVCGRKLPVPTLRAIRQLQPAQTSISTTPPSWNPAKGFIFAVGALLLIGGLIVAVHSYFVYSNVVKYKPSSADLDYSLEIIEQMTATDLWDAWHFVKQHGLEAPRSSDFAMAQDMANAKLRQAYIGSIVALVGLVCALVSFFMPAS